MAERALAHIEKIAWIKPIAGADNIEKIGVLGWVLIARKGEFQVGDLACFFEIDSKLPEAEWSKFLESKKYKVKTMKLGKFEKESGGVISQGLALPLSNVPALEDKELNVGDDVTELIGVTYAVAEDNHRKAKVDPNAKYKRMAARHPKLAKKSWFRWLMKRQWGKDFLFFFLGKKKDKPLGFPTQFEFVHKTDEVRCENLPQEFLENKEPWIQTLKIDGTSGTYILERLKHKKYEYYVCSRNVRQLTPDQETFHEDNVYWGAEEKYHIRDFLQDMLEKHPDWKYVALQGEIVGENIQGNPHKLTGLNFFGFNLIDSESGRWNSADAREICKNYGIEWVPIISESYVLPDTMEELKLQADGPCDLPGSSGLREGFVYRGIKDPNMSFKNVSRQYLLQKVQRCDVNP